MRRAALQQRRSLLIPPFLPPTSRRHFRTHKPFVRFPQKTNCSPREAVKIGRDNTFSSEPWLAAITLDPFRLTLFALCENPTALRLGTHEWHRLGCLVVHILCPNSSAL
jgi:hypothetical protein